MCNRLKCVASLFRSMDTFNGGRAAEYLWFLAEKGTRLQESVAGSNEKAGVEESDSENDSHCHVFHVIYEQRGAQKIWKMLNFDLSKFQIVFQPTIEDTDVGYNVGRGRQSVWSSKFDLA